MGKRRPIPKRQKPINLQELLEKLDQAWAEGDYTAIISQCKRLASNQQASIEVNLRWSSALERSGDRDAAIKRLERTRSLPNYRSELAIHRASLQNELARLYVQAGQFDESIALLEQTIREFDDKSKLYSNLVSVLEGAERSEAALETAVVATDLYDTDFELWCQRAELEQTLKRWDQAVVSCERCLELNPEHTRSYRRLVAVHRKRDDQDATADALRRWLNQDPENVVAKHLLAAYTSPQVHKQPDPQYIKQVFDEFADTFEEQLRDLGYVCPERLLAIVARRLGQPSRSLCVLDAGCGTGLLADGLREFASHLVGVDLSEGMIAKARSRPYDQLYCDEIVHYLADHPDRFDAIASTDTVNYIGDLNPVLESAFQSLHSGGMLFFTIEKQTSISSDSGFRLNPSGRYSHHSDYVRKTLEHAGFHEIECNEDVLRQENEQPVIGEYWSAKKS